MADPIIIGYGQIKFIQDANTKMVFLATGTEVSSAGADLQTAAAGAALATYTVPARKKFILLKFQFMMYQSANAHAMEIFERYGGANYKKSHYSINNSGQFGTSSAAMNENTATCETYMEFQAGSTVRIASTDGSIQADCLALGVETDV